MEHLRRKYLKLWLLSLPHLPYQENVDSPESWRQVLVYQGLLLTMNAAVRVDNGGSSSSRWFSGALTCGLKFREPDAKDLKVAAGFSVSLGIITIEVTQTSTKPEIYIGAGLVLVQK
jgi:hypothetical protein